MNIPRKLPSPATALSTTAVVIAMAGTGYAAVRLPRASVGARQLKADAVTSAKVLNGSLTRADFGDTLPSGPAGAPGPAGPAGPAGPTGPAPDLSAYYTRGQADNRFVAMGALNGVQATTTIGADARWIAKNTVTDHVAPQALGDLTADCKNSQLTVTFHNTSTRSVLVLAALTRGSWTAYPRVAPGGMQSVSSGVDASDGVRLAVADLAASGVATSYDTWSIGYGTELRNGQQDCWMLTDMRNTIS